MRLRVTVDTNVLDREKIAHIQKAAAAVEVELAFTTVTERERPGSESEFVVAAAVPETMVWDEGRWDDPVWGRSVAETAVMGEWVLGKAVLGDENSADRFAQILRLVSSGNVPNRRQVRDAIALEAHARVQRDVFVTDDKRAFGHSRDDPRRLRLEDICQTTISSVDEFCSWIRAVAS